jgi:N4-gp56 family major capsid protein
MAATEFGVNHPLAIKKWAPDLMKETLKKTYALQFMSKGKESLCTIKTDLTDKEGGDRIRVGIRSQLQGAGVKGDNTLEGNEEALETFNQDVYIDQLRHAVRSKGKMSEQRVPFSVRAEGRDGLADWWSERIDRWFFNQLCGNTGEGDDRYYGFNAPVAPDADHITYHQSGSTADSSISNTTVAKFKLKAIDTAVEKAKLAKNAVRPIVIGGKKHYVVFLHTFQVTDLRTDAGDSQWKDIQYAAMQGGKISDNPIFTGALGMYNDCILHESTRVCTSPTNASVKRAVLCGAQSLSIAFGRKFGKNVFSWKENLFDYDNQLGIAAGCQAGMIKTRFDGSDYGTVVIPTWAVASA